MKLRTVFPAIDHSSYWRSMLADDGQVAALQIDPSHRPIHARAVGLIVVCAEADVQHRGAMLKGLQECAMASFAIGMRII